MTAGKPVQDRKNNLQTTQSGGRFVTKYTPDLAIQMCERIAEGETLKGICDGSKVFPSRQTFHRWVAQYPELSRAYQVARTISAHSMEEEALDLARKLAREAVDPKQIRALDVAINQLRWSAAKRNPQVYSEKAEAKFIVPIQINTSLDMGGGDTAEIPGVYSLEATLVHEAEPGPAPDPMTLDAPPLEDRAPRAAPVGDRSTKAADRSKPTLKRRTPAQAAARKRQIAEKKKKGA